MSPRGLAARRGAPAVASLCAAVVVTGVLRQDHAPSPSALSFPVSSVVVNVYAVVSDHSGRLVADLPREAFQLSEDGVPQTIEHFSLGTDLPLSLGLLIDTSPSQQQTLPAQREEARKFLGSVLGPGDQAFVTRFDLDVELLQGFTGELSLLTEAIDKARVNTGDHSLLPDPPGRARGGTRLNDALFLASNELMKSEWGRKVVVLVTDGMDQGSLVKRRAAIEACERADVIAYAVAVCDPAFYWLRNQEFLGLEALSRVTRATGGRVVRVGDGHDTAAAFAEIARELRAHYRLGYTPPAGDDDGLRRIQVRVSSSHYRVRTRRGYYRSATGAGK